MLGGYSKLRIHGLRSILILSIILLTLTATALSANAAGTTFVTRTAVVNPAILHANDLVVHLSVSPVSALIDHQVMVNVSVTFYNGTAADGATIQLTSSPSGTFGKSSYTTVKLFLIGSGGSVVFNNLNTTFQASSASTYTITATATKTDYNTGTASSQVTYTALVKAPTPTPDTSTPVPPVVTPDTSSQSQAVTVTLTVTPTAAVSAVTAVATATETTAANNTTVAGTGNNGLGGLTAILPYIVAAVIIILLILLVFLYLWTKKTLKIVPKEAVAPCDGKTEIPVKVMFVNGFGSSRKPKSDVEVEMKTTAGTIKNVVLPSSRDFIDASLIAPKEFGQATISATANGKTATAPVSFTYKHASFDVSVTPDNIPSDGKSSANVKLQIKDENGSVIAPIVERNVELKTTLGAITTPVKIPSKATEANATITAGDVSGTAVIYAVSGDIKGEGKVSFKGLPKRFCMHCGTRMDMDAASCPKCGLTPPSGVDTKACPTCNTVIPEAAKYCYNCGARQSEQAIKVDPTQQ